jgi:hypothetical protein
VYYVHGTKIVHYKGESTRRSDIDELKHFYGAMQLFVGKHFAGSRTVSLILNLGILLRRAAAWIGRLARPAAAAFFDAFLVALTLTAGEYMHFGKLFHFPQYAYPMIWIVPSAIVVTLMAMGGMYGKNPYAVVRSMAAVASGYVIISAIVFFVKEFAFSRAVVLLAGAMSLVLVPGWRLAVRAMARNVNRRSLFGRRAVIVGTGHTAQEVLRRLRARMDDGYDVLGFIDTTRRRIGERVSGIEILGSIDNVGKVIDEHRVGEVIFTTDGVTYENILSVIARNTRRNVNFRLVPGSLEAIVGKTHIDQLDALPLVDIEYNIHKPFHRFSKRLFDILVAGFLLLTLYPVARVCGSSSKAIDSLPRVLRGELSLVGLPGGQGGTSPPENVVQYLGPEGIAGLVQLHDREDLDNEERERYKLYYAKNQSLLLDMEILVKSMLSSKRR